MRYVLNLEKHLDSEATGLELGIARLSNFCDFGQTYGILIRASLLSAPLILYLEFGKNMVWYPKSL